MDQLYYITSTTTPIITCFDLASLITNLRVSPTIVNKKWWYWIPLSKTLLDFEGLSKWSIYQYWDWSTSHTPHYPLNHSSNKPNMMKHVFKKILSYRVICFSKVKLEKHLYFSSSSANLLTHELWSIHNLPILNKSCWVSPVML